MNASKVECLNPNTGSRMKVDAETYQLFVEAIRDSLKDKKPLTFSEIVRRIKSYFKKTKTEFPGSVGWYAVAVKNDMQVRGQLKVYTEKGKKLHMMDGSLKKAK